MYNISISLENLSFIENSSVLNIVPYYQDNMTSKTCIIYFLQSVIVIRYVIFGKMDNDHLIVCDHR